jgi:hypothetical protein
LLLIRNDSGAVSIMDGNFMPLLGYLEQFRTLQQHGDVVLAKNPRLRPHEQVVRELLRRLSQDGILVSGDKLLEKLFKPVAAEPRTMPPLRISITTCDRPPQLERLLSSLLDNERAHANTWTYEIVDDSRNASSVEQNLAIVSQYSTSLDLRYHGRSDRDAIITRLTRELPQVESQLRWLLDSWHPAHVGQRTYGCSKNYLMLRHAGNRLILLDDDAVLRTWIHPDTRQALRFAQTGIQRSVAADIATLTSNLKTSSLDPIAEHSRILGCSLHEVVHVTRTAVTTNDLLGRASLAEIPQVIANPPKIRATMNALVGDPGTTTDLAVLYRDRDIAALAANDSACQALLEGQRCVFTGESYWSLTNQGYFMLATMAGLDLSTYMAPLMPIGRGEDAMIGFMLKTLYPDDLSIVFPWAIEHRPVSPRPWQLTAKRMVKEISPIFAWQAWVAAAGIGTNYADPLLKLHAISNHFHCLATTPTGRDQLRHSLNAAIKMIWAHDYGELARAYQSTPGGGTYWRAHLARALRELQELLGRQDIFPSSVIDVLLDQNCLYWETLPAWSSALELMQSDND